MMNVLFVILAGLGAYAEEEPAPSEEVVENHRASPPEVVFAEAIDLPEWVTSELSTGATLYFSPQKGLRKSTIRVDILQGHLDIMPLSEANRSFHNSLLSRATDSYGAEALELLSELHDLDISAWHSYHETGVQISVPNEDVSFGFEVLSSILMEPSFPRKEMKLRRQELMRYYETNGPASPGSVASAALSFGWYDASQPYGVRPNIESLNTVKRAQLRKRHAQILASGAPQFLVVGDMTEAEAKALVEPLAQRLQGAAPRNEPPAAIVPTKKQIFAVDMPDAKQAIIRFRMPGPRMNEPDQAAVSLANWVLGGHFMSRLNRNIREEKGLTYGVYSRYSSSRQVGHITARLDVAKDNARVAVEEILSEFTTLGTEGLTALELEDAQISKLTSWNTSLQSSYSTAGFYGSLLNNQWDVAEAKNRMETAQRLSLDTVNSVLERWFLPKDQWTLVLVGPRVDLEAQFPADTFELRWISPEDAILGSM